MAIYSLNIKEYCHRLRKELFYVKVPYLFLCTLSPGEVIVIDYYDIGEFNVRSHEL